MNTKFTDILKKQLLRGDCLQICAAAGSDGAGVQLISIALAREGITASVDTIMDALHYLLSKGLVVEKCFGNKALNVRMKFYQITADGIDVLEGTKEVDGVELDLR
jgi:hypothetical protein